MPALSGHVAYADEMCVRNVSKHDDRWCLCRCFDSRSFNGWKHLLLFYFYHFYLHEMEVLCLAGVANGVYQLLITVGVDIFP